jgi:hypothetical protein
MKRAVATEMATDMPRSMYAQGYLIRLSAPGNQLGMAKVHDLQAECLISTACISLLGVDVLVVREDDAPSRQMIAVSTTVQVQMNELHHHFAGELHTSPQACSNSGVSRSQRPTDDWRPSLASCEAWS